MIIAQRRVGEEDKPPMPTPIKINVTPVGLPGIAFAPAVGGLELEIQVPVPTAEVGVASIGATGPIGREGAGVLVGLLLLPSCDFEGSRIVGVGMGGMVEEDEGEIEIVSLDGEDEDEGVEDFWDVVSADGGAETGTEVEVVDIDVDVTAVLLLDGVGSEGFLVGVG
jgi:hypothetical protein